jgi:peroxiredoxin family protein
MHFGGMGKWMLGSIMKDKNIMSLPELMDAAESQGVRFIACTMSMEVMGISKRDLKPRPNLEFGGVAAFVEAAHGAGKSLVLTCSCGRGTWHTFRA